MGSADEVGVVILVTAGLVVLVESLGEAADWGPPPPCGFSSPLAWACCPHTWWWFSQSLCWQNGPQYRATLQPLHVSVAFRPQFQQLYGKNNEYPHKHRSRFQRPRLFRSTPRIETSGQIGRFTAVSLHACSETIYFELARMHTITPEPGFSSFGLTLSRWKTRVY